MKTAHVKIKSLRSVDDKFGKAVCSSVMTVENRIHEAILTAVSNVVIPRVEMAVRSVTESSGRGPNSVVQNSDRMDFTGNTGNTPLVKPSSRINLNIDQERNDQTRNVQNFKDGGFPALGPNYDR